MRSPYQKPAGHDERIALYHARYLAGQAIFTGQLLGVRDAVLPIPELPQLPCGMSWDQLLVVPCKSCRRELLSPTHEHVRRDARPLLRQHLNRRYPKAYACGEYLCCESCRRGNGQTCES